MILLDDRFGLAYFCASNKLISKFELHTGKNLFKQSAESDETFINIKSIPCINGAFCLSNLNRLYLILSPPFYNKSKCVLEMDLAGLALLEHETAPDFQFNVSLEPGEEPLHGESQPTRVDLRQYIQGRRQLLPLLILLHPGGESVGLDNQNESRRCSKARASRAIQTKKSLGPEKSKTRMDFLSEESSFLVSPVKKQQTMSNKKKFQITLSREEDKPEHHILGKTKVISGKEPETIPSKNDAQCPKLFNKAFDHFFVKVMEVHTTGIQNPLFQKKLFMKKAEDYRLDPERFKRDVEKQSIPKVTKTIFKGLNNKKNVLGEEEEFIQELFLSRALIISTRGRQWLRDQSGLQ